MIGLEHVVLNLMLLDRCFQEHLNPAIYVLYALHGGTKSRQQSVSYKQKHENNVSSVQSYVAKS
jgi:hypothetical protein